MELNSYRDEADHADDQSLLDDSPPKRPRRKAWDLTKRSSLIGAGCLLLVIFIMLSRIRGPADKPVDPDSPIAPGIRLRILPVGDSITEGYRSSDKNGYRNALLQDLESLGSEVDFIGSEESGNMTKPRHCGFGGFTINQIDAKVDACLTGKPNIVLLHAGTNDMDRLPQDGAYDEAPQRLGALIDKILAAVPEVAMVVAQLVQSEALITSERITVFNKAIPKVVAERVAKGAKIVVVNMESIGGDVETSADGLHPNDDGYRMMAGYWMEGLRKLSGMGAILPLVE